MSGTKQIYLVVGVPCAGKSWICEQLGELYSYVRHDDYKDTNKYIAAIVGAAAMSSKPLLIETPFSMSQIAEPLESHDYKIEPVFVIESHDTLRQRYRARERKEIPAGHLTRQDTYEGRACALQAYAGTSGEVLAFLIKATDLTQPKDKWPWQT